MRRFLPQTCLAAGWLLSVVPRLVAPPSPAGTPLAPVAARALALGVPERAATALWWSTSTQWVRDDRLAPAVLGDRLAALHGLDPTWSTPWIYGGLMLQTQGDRDAARPVLEAGAAHFPDQPWFAAALGVAHADAGELDEARTWLDRARRP